MAQYTKETIKFNNVINPSWTVGTDGPFSPYRDSERSGFSAANYLEMNRSSIPSGNEGLYFTTNAIDIHWGGANVAGTTVWNAPNDVVLKTQYKYYTGVTSATSFTLNDLNQTTTDKPTTLSFGAATEGGSNYQTFIYPSSWGKPTSMMAGGLDGKNGWYWGDDAGMTSLPSGYTAAVHQGGAVTYEVTW